MAIDWNKEISFSGLRKAAPKVKNDAFPTKEYMNLAVADSRKVELRKVVLVGALLLVVVVAFAKFGVFDFIDRVNVKQAELSEQQLVLSGLEAQLQEYSDVEADYQAYVSARNATDSAMADAVTALSLVDDVIAPAASVTALDYQRGVLSLNLTNISLRGVGNLSRTLKEHPIVSDVSVSTAATDETAADDVAVAMIVTLREGGEEQ